MRKEITLRILPVLLLMLSTPLSLNAATRRIFNFPQDEERFASFIRETAASVPHRTVYQETELDTPEPMNVFLFHQNQKEGYDLLSCMCPNSQSMQFLAENTKHPVALHPFAESKNLTETLGVSSWVGSVLLANEDACQQTVTNIQQDKKVTNCTHKLFTIHMHQDSKLRLRTEGIFLSASPTLRS